MGMRYLLRKLLTGGVLEPDVIVAGDSHGVRRQVPQRCRRRPQSFVKVKLFTEDLTHRRVPRQTVDYTQKDQ